MVSRSITTKVENCFLLKLWISLLRNGVKRNKKRYELTNQYFFVRIGKNILRTVVLSASWVSIIEMRENALVNKNWTRGNEELERKNEKLD